MLKKLLSIGLALVLSLNMGLLAFAAENNQNTSQEATYEETATMDDVYSLKPYVVVNENGTLSLDVQLALDNGENETAINALTHHFDVINPQIESGKLSVGTDLDIIGGNHPIASHYCSLGINSYSTYWWGFQRYSCNCETRRIVSDLNTWASGGTMVGGAAAGIAIVFPAAAPIAGAIAAGAAFDTGYWWLLATRIDANNQGRGVITNMTHVLIFDIIPQ